MKPLDVLSLKTVRWSGWLLLILAFGFLVTGYIMSGRFGLGVWMEEKQALTLHKLFHLPLILLLLFHVVPAIYLALIRWGWMKK
jgi:hypothetical protein